MCKGQLDGDLLSIILYLLDEEVTVPKSYQDHDKTFMNKSIICQAIRGFNESLKEDGALQDVVKRFKTLSERNKIMYRACLTGDYNS